MLDFYSIPDESDVPEFPDEDLYLGSIDLAQHRDLCLMFESICVELPPSYFEDSRYTSSAVRALHVSLEARAQQWGSGDGATRGILSAFVSILERALSQGNGLVAFCD